MDLSTFVARTAARLNIDSSDPLYGYLDEFANESLHLIETAAPDGWPWMRRTLTLTTAADDNDYAFSAISTTTTITKILDAKILVTTGFYSPLDLISPEDAELQYPSTSSSIPEGWYAEGRVFYLYPAPDAAYTVKIRVVTQEPDLGGNGSTPVLPTIWHTAVIDQMLLLAYQQLQDVNRTDVQQRRMEDHIGRMRRAASEYSRNPRVTVRDPLVI